MTIREARLAAELTQVEVSELLQIPRRTLQTWELGQRVPPVYVENLVIEKLQHLVMEREGDCMNEKTMDIHEMYMKCKEVFDPSISLLDEVENISDKEEKLFYETLTNFFLKQKQKEAIENGVF